jgi:hypothetical protein
MFITESNKTLSFAESNNPNMPFEVRLVMEIAMLVFSFCLISTCVFQLYNRVKNKAQGNKNLCADDHFKNFYAQTGKDLLPQILERLSSKDVVALASTSKQHQRIVYNQPRWMPLVLDRIFNAPPQTILPTTVAKELYDSRLDFKNLSLLLDLPNPLQLRNHPKLLNLLINKLSINWMETTKPAIITLSEKQMQNLMELVVVSPDLRSNDIILFFLIQSCLKEMNFKKFHYPPNFGKHIYTLMGSPLIAKELLQNDDGLRSIISPEMCCDPPSAQAAQELRIARSRFASRYILPDGVDKLAEWAF